MDAVRVIKKFEDVFCVLLVTMVLVMMLWKKL